MPRYAIYRDGKPLGIIESSSRFMAVVDFREQYPAVRIEPHQSLLAQPYSRLSQNQKEMVFYANEHLKRWPERM